jgi:DNA-binding winged helix-turn-helix (wHTH) protein/Flp pilus assembly protein TadD
VLESLPKLGHHPHMNLSASGKKIARFGLYEADLRGFVLTKGGLRVRLQDQPFQLLAVLLERPGEVVTREEIRQKLWPVDTFVEFDDGLNNAIKKLRAALSDAADNPRFIETVPRHGYRFLAPVDFDAVTAGPATLNNSPALTPTGPNEQVIVATRDRLVVEQTYPSRAWLWARVGAVIVVIAAGLYGAYLWRRSSATRLTEKDTIVLADFANTTGESVFTDALKQALSVDLSQSPFLNVVSDEKVSATLGLMGRPSNEPVTREVAREVCLRMGSKAILVGSIASLGSHYVVGLEAIGCASGDSLAKGQAETANKEGVVKTLNGLASQVRSKIGESVPSLEKYDFAVDTTTKSLEALKAYSVGTRMVREKGEAEAIPFFEQAIQLDPDFAMAYADLGIAYDNSGENGRAVENLAKAYSLRDKVSERERYRITAMYYSDVTGDLEREKEICQLWTQTYPRDSTARGLLGVVYATLGQREQGAVQFREALRLNPESAINYGNAAVSYIALDRLDEANAFLDQAQARGLDGLIVHENRYSIAFLRGDAAEMQRQVAWAVGNPGVEDHLLSQHSDTMAYFGELAKARELSKRAVESAVRGADKETAATWEINAAMRELEIGNLSLAQQGVRAALSLASTRDTKVAAAVVLAGSGDIAHAKLLIGELENDNPSNTILKAYWLPTLKASLEVHAGHSREAISLLQIAAPYELGEAAYIFNMYPAYLRGQAYLVAGDGAAAAAEFKKLMDHPGIVQNDILGALSRLQLARAKAMMGDLGGTRNQYKDFFLLWKDADRDIPILQEARAEYAKLK